MRVVLFILSALCCELSAATYYVATNGNDATGTGAQGAPWLTVQKGVNSALAGDTLLVGSGVYTQEVLSARSGTIASRITLDGQGVAQVYSFLLQHSNITLQNFTISGKTNGYLLYMYPNGDNCIVSNNVVDGQFANGMPIVKWEGSGSPPFGDAGSDNLIISNTFKRGMGVPMIASFGDRNVFFGNRLLDSDAVDWFRVFGRTNYVVGNYCSNLFVSGLAANHPDFFQAFGSSGYGAMGTLIESNTVLAMHGDSQLCMFEGQDSPNVRDFIFRNNLFVGVSCKGTMACPYVRWYNNTFIDCATNSAAGPIVLVFTTATNATYSDFALSSGHGGEAFNNVFFNCGDGRLDVGWYSFATYLTNVQADYNFVARSNYGPVNADSLQRSVGEPGGWDTFKWWEENGINGGNPFFYNNTNDLRLQAISPLIGAGTNLDFSVDIRGTARGATWDIGAYEYLHPLTYLATNPVACDLQTRSLMGIVVSAPNVITLAWPTNQYGNVVQIYRRNFTNDPTQWPNWTLIYTNAGSPISAGVFNDTNVTAGVHYEYQLRTGSTNLACGTNIDFGYYGFQYLNGGWQVPLRDQRGNVILLCESGITNALVTELATLVSDLRGDGYRVFRHDIAAVDVPTNGLPGTWFTAVTNTKALIVADYNTAPSDDWTIFIVGHVPIPYSGDTSPGFHADNVGAHPADWYYADTNAAAWTDSTVNDTTSDFPDAHNIPGDGKFDQDQPPTTPELRLGRIDLRNMPAFGLTEVQLLSQYLNRAHQWRHKQFTVRDRALVGTNSSVTVPPYEVYGTYAGLFGNGTNYDVANWLTTATNPANSYLMASSHGNGLYTQDLLLGHTTNFAASSLYSVFNSHYGSYFGDWDSAIHSNDVALAPLATVGYTLGVYHREQQVNMNPSSMGEPYADDLWFQAASFFTGSSAWYVQLGNWFTNGSTFLNPLRVRNYTSYMGDPMLRIRQVAPPTNVVITPSGNDSIVTWTASSDATHGYHVYRAPTSDLNAFTRLTTSPTTSPYTDAGAASGAYTYMVRTVKLEQSDSRSYFAASQGEFGTQSVVAQPTTSSTIGGRATLSGNAALR